MGSPHKENIQMATRMQQRRGTAAQWTAANPILAAGEIGFETDTSKFKMGNGSSAWSALTYFANAAELSAIIDGAPAALNTLNELAEAMGDNPAFLTNLNIAVGDVDETLTLHTSATTSVHGIADTSDLVTSSELTDAISTATVDQSTLAGVGIDWNAQDEQFDIDSTVATKSYADDAIGTHNSDSTSVHGIANTADLATKSYADDAIGTHSSDSTSVHGIADTSALATKTYADDAVSAHNFDTTNVHGIDDTSALATKTYADGAVSTHGSDTTDVHGIANTANLATKAYADDAVSTHNSDTTNVHGITDTADLATKVYADAAVTTHNDDTTNVHGIADTSLLVTTTGTQTLTNKTITSPAGLVKADVGLGNVDNTADTAKPVSTSQASAIATAKSEAIADATAQVQALLTGAPEALNTLDELAAALGDDANFAATVTTNLGLKVDSLTPISQKTASYTLSSLTERDDLIEMGSASALTLTIPPASAVDYPIGTSIDILQTGAGQVTVAAGAGVTVNATPGLKLRTTWSSATLFKRAANTWVVFGDLTA
jgi:hypothetical protein